jgi:hypothetical protein
MDEDNQRRFQQQQDAYRQQQQQYQQQNRTYYTPPPSNPSAPAPTAPDETRISSTQSSTFEQLNGTSRTSRSINEALASRSSHFGASDFSNRLAKAEEGLVTHKTRN